MKRLAEILNRTGLLASVLVLTPSVSVSHLQSLRMIPNHLEEVLESWDGSVLTKEGNDPRPEGRDERRVEGNDWAMAAKPEGRPEEPEREDRG